MTDNHTKDLPPLAEQVATGGEPLTPETVAGGSAGKDGSTFTVAYGRRTLKAYPIFEEELGQLFLIGLFTTVCFSIASFLLAIGFNIHLSLSFSQTLPNNKAIYWSTLRDGAWILGLIFLIVGAILAIFGKNRLNKIKLRTEF